MKVIITMAGLSKRFSMAGYNTPKYKIVVDNRSLLEWSLLSLSNFYSNEFIFISRTAIWDEEFVKSVCNKLNIKQYNSILLTEETNGQATTTMAADSLIGENESVAIYNIDTYVKPGEISIKNTVQNSGTVPVFEAEGDKWSFAKINMHLEIEQITEKKRISEYATIGFYYFTTWGDFKNIYNMHKHSIKKEYGEIYIAPMYQYLIERGKKIFAQIIDKDHVKGLGTPEDVLNFSL